MEKQPEEKKCSVCGRPNLEKAKKCWYCQSPLDGNDEATQDSLLTEEEMLNHQGEESSFVKSSTNNKPPREKDSTPEWLRKVRELIAADSVEEEEIDEWQQQQLFEKENASLSEETSSSENPEAPTSSHKAETTNPDELPDGFTQFSTDDSAE